jgi:hypothetical protein
MRVKESRHAATDSPRGLKLRLAQDRKRDGKTRLGRRRVGERIKRVWRRERLFHPVHSG